jgi:hypothetical protein
MFQPHLRHRVFLILGLGATGLLVPRPAKSEGEVREFPSRTRGGPRPSLQQSSRRVHLWARLESRFTSSVRICATAFKEAQNEVSATHLLGAKELYRKCAAPSCGSPLERVCTARYLQIENDVPTFVPVVVDSGGNPLSLVEVRLDGKVLTYRLEGQAFPLDPGIHSLAFATDDGVFATAEVLMAQGQRNRIIAVSLPAPTKDESKAANPVRLATEAAVEPEVHAIPREPLVLATAETPALGVNLDLASRSLAAERRTPALTYVFGGLGALAVGGYATLIYWGRKDNSRLSECKPGCPPASVDHIRRMYLAADVSLGVGVAALGVATWLFLRSPVLGEASTTQLGYSFGVQPTASGAVASVGGPL